MDKAFKDLARSVIEEKVKGDISNDDKKKFGIGKV